VKQETRGFGSGSRSLGLVFALTALGALWLLAGTAHATYGTPPQGCSTADGCMAQSSQARTLSDQKFQQAASQSKAADAKAQQAALYQAAANQAFASGDAAKTKWYVALRDDANNQATFIRAAAQQSFQQGMFLRAAADGYLNQGLALQDAADEPIEGAPADGGDQASAASGKEYCKDPKNFNSGNHNGPGLDYFNFWVDVNRFCHRGGYAVTLAAISNPQGSGWGYNFTAYRQPSWKGCSTSRSWYHYNHKVGGIYTLGGSESGRKIRVKCWFDESDVGTEFGQVYLYFHSDGSYHYGKTEWWHTG
jgi:hypothetical protein